MIVLKLFREWGYDVRIVTPEKTAVDIVYSKYKRSKCLERNGKYYGVTAFCRGHCIMSGLKQIALSKDAKPSLIGIAFDEPERLKRIRKPNRSLIAENGLTEKDCFTLCRENGLLSPLYDIPGLNRGGCFSVLMLIKEKYNIFVKIFQNYIIFLAILLKCATMIYLLYIITGLKRCYNETKILFIEKHSF